VRRTSQRCAAQNDIFQWASNVRLTHSLSRYPLQISSSLVGDIAPKALSLLMGNFLGEALAVHIQESDHPA